MVCGSSWSNFNRDTLEDLQSTGLQCLNLLWIVRQKVNARNSQIYKDCGTRFIIAFICVESQLAVCFHRISTVVLKLIRDELVEQTDATSFLRVVNNDASARFVDRPHGKLQLISTVAAGGRENISRQALRMNPN